MYNNLNRIKSISVLCNSPCGYPGDSWLRWIWRTRDTGSFSHGTPPTHSASWPFPSSWRKPRTGTHGLGWTSQNSGTWTHISAREAGKCNLIVCPGRREQQGFGWQLAFSVITSMLQNASESKRRESVHKQLWEHYNISSRKWWSSKTISRKVELCKHYFKWTIKIRCKSEGYTGWMCF